MLGLELGDPLIPWITIAAGMIAGIVIGGFQGFLIGYLTIPAFIVTLGGFLVWRNVAWYMTSGRTIGPLDPVFLKFGGINGTLGATGSWIFAALAVAAALYALYTARRNKLKHGFPVKPMWAEGVMALIISGVILGFVGILTAYKVPVRKLQRMF